MRTETKQFFTKFIAGAILLGVIVFLLFFVVKGVRGGNVIPPDNVTTTKFNGNYPSSQIRELWQVCSATFQMRHPQLPQPLRWDVCDCYTDVIRKTLSPDAAKNATPEEARKLTLTLIDQCNGMFEKKPSIMT
jgi:hypothetical protein